MSSFTHDGLQEDLAAHLRGREEWRGVVGYEDLYQVSSLGRFKLLERVVTKVICGVAKDYRYKEKIKKLKPGAYGYVYAQLTRDGVSTMAKVHTLVLNAFVGPRPDGMHCRHINSVRHDNRLSNLAWGTVKENANDRVELGTYAIGDTHERARFTSDQLEAMRIEALSTTRALVQAKYGISKTHLGRVMRGVARSTRVHGGKSC